MTPPKIVLSILSERGGLPGDSWHAPQLPPSLERRRERQDTTKAVSRTRIDRLCRRREKTLWRMLYESAARAGEVLALNVEDLDLANKQAVRRSV